MASLDWTDIELKRLITHHVGNKSREEEFHLCSDETVIEEDSRDYLVKYFIQAFKGEEFFQFGHTVDLKMNDVYVLIQAMFSKEDKFIENSQHLARLLNEHSTHPKILQGELNVAHFTNIALDGKATEAIGIFKSESDAPFIKMKQGIAKFAIKHDFGFEIKGIDKGCLIFNVEKGDGYRVIVSDSLNRNADAQYWKDDFLKIVHVADEFHQTKEFMTIAKTFVTKKLTEEFEVTKADQIDLLNRSVDYFKSHETFDKNEFEKEVFQDKGIIKSFRSFDESYREEHDIELTESFDISAPAVKKQAKIFKSVLKLDKNFHIYIHGNREMIEQGVEKDGRKFYKIYFEKEV